MNVRLQRYAMRTARICGNEVSYIREGKGKPFRKKITAKRILNRFKNIVADAWENSVVRRTLILTLIVLAISLIFTSGYNLGKIVGAETQTEEYLDGRLEQ